MRPAAQKMGRTQNSNPFVQNRLRLVARRHRTCSDFNSHHMTVNRFLRPGEGEMVKGSVHAAVCGLALICGVYNAAAWLTRRERHLGVNAVLYAGLALWEASHVRHHSQRSLKAVAVPAPEWVGSPLAGASTVNDFELAS